MDIMKEGVFRCTASCNNTSGFESQTTQQGQLQHCPGLDKQGEDNYFGVTQKDMVCHFLYL